MTVAGCFSTATNTVAGPSGSLTATATVNAGNLLLVVGEAKDSFAPTTGGPWTEKYRAPNVDEYIGWWAHMKPNADGTEDTVTVSYSEPWPGGCTFIYAAINAIADLPDFSGYLDGDVQVALGATGPSMVRTTIKANTLVTVVYEQPDGATVSSNPNDVQLIGSGRNAYAWTIRLWARPVLNDADLTGATYTAPSGGGVNRVLSFLCHTPCGGPDASGGWRVGSMGWS